MIGRTVLSFCAVRFCRCFTGVLTLVCFGELVTGTPRTQEANVRSRAVLCLSMAWLSDSRIENAVREIGSDQQESRARSCRAGEQPRTSTETRRLQLASFAPAETDRSEPTPRNVASHVRQTRSTPQRRISVRICAPISLKPCSCKRLKHANKWIAIADCVCIACLLPASRELSKTSCTSSRQSDQDDVPHKGSTQTS